MKWITFVFSCLSMATAGTISTFAVFSDGLRAKFGFGTSDINLISSCGTGSLYVTLLIIGPLYDKLGVKFTMVSFLHV
jgi:hypothetical protein